MSEAVRPLFGAPPGTDAAAQRASLRAPSWRQAPPGEAPAPLFSPEQTPEAIARRAREAAEHEARKLALAQAEAKKQEEAQARAGFVAGHESGSRAAAAEYQGRIAEVGRSLATLAQLREQVMSGSERQVVDLALHVAGQVLLSDTAQRREFTQRMVGEALALLREADSISLRMRPEDLTALKAAQPDLFAMPHVNVVEDPQVALGGVIADCPLGRVDATLDARLAAIAARLLPEGAP